MNAAPSIKSDHAVALWNGERCIEQPRGYVTDSELRTAFARVLKPTAPLSEFMLAIRLFVAMENPDKDVRANADHHDSMSAKNRAARAAAKGPYVRDLDV